MGDRVLTIPEAAAHIRMSEDWTYRAARQGDLPAFKIGRNWRFRMSDLNAWVEAQTKGESMGSWSSWAAS
jgi:excisionase family DNA binding protein